MRKKIVSLFSAMALFITLVCTAFVNVSAAGEVKVTSAANLTTAKPGDTVRVDLNLAENPGLISLHLRVNYDKDVFEFSSLENKQLFEVKPFEVSGDGFYGINWADYTAAENYTFTGIVASVSFKVKDTAENGNYEFSITAVEDDIMDYDLNQLPIILENTSVKVSDGLNDDATLKSLTVSNGTLAPEFDPAVEEYTVAVPYGKGVPTVAATANDAKATVKITQATGYESGKNEATVEVTAENKKTVKTYKITFTEINAVLSALTVNGASVTGFDPDVTSYTYTVPYADWNADKAKTYAIAATASKETSTVEIGENDFALTSADSDKNADKSVTVTVTSEQGDKTEYTIKFTVLACEHDYVINEAGSTPATCTDAGENLLVCSVCAKEKTEAVDALGHDKNSEWTVVDATCETDGSRTQLCSRCGEQIGYEVINKTGHKWSRWTKVEGTENYERICSNCNTVQTRTVEASEDGHEHSFGGTSQIEVIKPATCAEDGLRRVWCSNENCNQFIEENIDKLNHTPNTEVVEATCTEAGRTTVTCQVCGEKISETVIDPLGHDYDENAWTKDATHHWHACKRCGTEIDKDSHSENGGVVTTPATPYSNGTRTYSCTVCGHVTRTEIIPAVPMTDGDNSSIDYSGGNTVAPVIPFGGIKTTESIIVSVENKITGEKSTASAQRSGDSVTVRLGSENNGNYANFYTTNDEYIYSAVIENGRAKLNVSSDVKIKVVIDSVAYGEDVSSEAAVNSETSEIASGNTMICMVSIILIAGAAVVTVFIKKRANK